MAGRRNLVRRAAGYLKQLFSSMPSDPEAEDEEEGEGGVGVREPRRPVRPSQSGAVALEPPPTERRDVRAIGEDRD